MNIYIEILIIIGCFMIWGGLGFAIIVMFHDDLLIVGIGMALIVMGFVPCSIAAYKHTYHYKKDYQEMLSLKNNENGRVSNI